MSNESGVTSNVIRVTKCDVCSHAQCFESVTKTPLGRKVCVWCIDDLLDEVRPIPSFPVRTFPERSH